MADWDRLPGETKRAYGAFLLYLNLTPTYKRTITKAWNRYKGGAEQARHPGYFGRWAADNQWLRRADAWDTEQERQRQQEYNAARIEARIKRMESVQTLQQLLDDVIDALDKDTSAAAFNQIANAGAKILNESRCEFNDLPTQRREIEAKIEKTSLSELSDEELLAIAEDE